MSNQIIFYLHILLVLKLPVSVSSVVGSEWTSLCICGGQTMDNLIRLFRPIGSHQHGVSQIHNTIHCYIEKNDA